MMADSVRMKGKTTEEAIKSALQVLGKTMEEVDVKVISESESGVLGVFGGKEAEVEVSTKTENWQAAKQILQDIMDKLGFMTLVTAAAEGEDAVNMEIKGDDMGRIIGKEGATLDALQYLVSVIMSKRKGKRVRIMIDAEGYRERRKKKILEDADREAKEAETSGKERPLPPMSAAERRIVHMHIQDNYPDLISYSRGEGSGRQLYIGRKPG